MNTGKQTAVLDRTKRNGLYIHYSAPRTLTSSTPGQIRAWARAGDLHRLRAMVLAGQGPRLLQHGPLEPRAGAALSFVPAMLRTCDDLHQAVTRGALGELQATLQECSESSRERFAACTDAAGVGLLHKAVYYDFIDIANWLLSNYPNLVHQRDSEGRTPLHYAAWSRGAEAVLVAAGAWRGARDAWGRTPAQYRAPQARQALTLPRPPADMPRPCAALPAPPHRLPATGAVVKRSNIRIWCHECDLNRLQRMVWEGHGARLLSEVSNQPYIKKFLEAVPYIMNAIREIHSAVVTDDLDSLRRLTSPPVLSIILSSRDSNNLTAMHKAAGLGRLDILRYISEMYPEGVKDEDNDGRTPLHYAASLGREHREGYDILIKAGAEEGKLDDKQKPAAYYFVRSFEIDKTPLLRLPDAPRTASSGYPSSWDWKILDPEFITDLMRKSKRKTKSSSDHVSVSETTANNTGNRLPTSSTQESIKALPELEEQNNFKNDKPLQRQSSQANIIDTASSKIKEVKKAEVPAKEIARKKKEELQMIPLTESSEMHSKDDNEKPNKLLDSCNSDNVSLLDANCKADPQDVTQANKEDDFQKDNGTENSEIKTQENNKESKQSDNNEPDNQDAKSNRLIEDNAVIATEKPKSSNYENQKVITTDCSNTNIDLINKKNNKDDSSSNNINEANEDTQNQENKQLETKNPNDGSEEVLQKAVSNCPDVNETKHSVSETKKSGKHEKHVIVDSVGDTKLESVMTGSLQTSNNLEDSSVNEGMLPESNMLIINPTSTEDDDDVAVPGDIESEYSESNQRSTAEASDTSSAKRGMLDGSDMQEDVIEKGINQHHSLRVDAEKTQNSGHLAEPENDDPEVNELISSHNMELLAALVLNGEGSRLVNRTSNNPEVQAFLNNVPTYMQKINKVHMAAREGNIRDLQAALDRRKFAIARDPISANGATPLHVATVFGKTNIIKYLGQRFPETLSAVDFEGRTALHYAAVLPDNNHYFYLLKQLGANSKDSDDNGCSAEEYLSGRHLTADQLMSDFGINKEEADEMLSDRGYSTLLQRPATEALKDERENVGRGEAESYIRSIQDNPPVDNSDIPLFKTEEGRYLAQTLGDPLIKALTEVANVKPVDPISYLASYLNNLPSNERPRIDTQTTTLTNREDLAYDDRVSITQMPTKMPIPKEGKKTKSGTQEKRVRASEEAEQSREGKTRMNTTSDTNMEGGGKTHGRREVEDRMIRGHVGMVESAGSAEKNTTKQREQTPGRALIEERLIKEGKQIDPKENKIDKESVEFDDLETEVGSQTEDTLEDLDTLDTEAKAKTNDIDNTTLDSQKVKSATTKPEDKDEWKQHIDVVTVDPNSEPSPDAPENALSSTARDEHGQSMLHFAAARRHSRHALFQLLQESEVSLAYRDELYRTARDVSIQANVPENTAEIDLWVLHLAARGELQRLTEMLLEGYDHIVDIADEGGVPIIEVVEQRGQTEMVNFLDSVADFEDSREALHVSIRRGDLDAVKRDLVADGGKALARGKNTFGRTSLHVAVLAQHEYIVEYLAEHFPELLRMGDNLERTPLHYAMGVDKIESLSRILIKAGAKRVLKDLKGRQPTYYFMNKSDISRLKEEEEIY